jgi:serine protease Do
MIILLLRQMNKILYFIFIHFIFYISLTAHNYKLYKISKMKRKLNVIVFVILSIGGLIAQNTLRETVAVVRPIYDKSTVKFLTDFSQSLKRDGYNEAANVLKSYVEGGFGTGLVYFDSETGTAYVITNRHVVAQSGSVTIEFYPIDKPVVRYKECQVVATDEYLDLALVELPDDVTLTNSLAIDSQKPEEGIDVFTAGYPGLGSEPSWQLGRGIISNSSVYSKELTFGADSLGIIQHTAQIDAGSSGSPLLLRDENAYGGYRVIGLNTWKAAGRENANFAIPGASITAFIKRFSERKALDENQLKEQVAEFAQSINKNYKQVLPYISSEYISNVSVNGFYDLLGAISEAARKDVIQSFNNGKPIDGVRIALADALCKKFGTRNLSFNAVEGYISPAQPVQVILNYGDKPLPTIWNAEQGEWKLQKLSALKLNDLENKGLSTSFGYRNSFQLGMGIPSGDAENIYYSVYFGRTYYTFITYGVFLGKGSMTFDMPDGEWRPNIGGYDTISVKKGYFYTDLALGVQLPVKISSIYLIPNIKGTVGINIGDETGAFATGFSAGVEAAYKLTGNNYLIAGIDYRKRYYTVEDDKFDPVSSFGFHLGITW